MKLEEALLFENFGDFRRALINAYEEHPDPRVGGNTSIAIKLADDKIDIFKEYRKRNKIPSNQQDISYWIGYINRDPRMGLVKFVTMLNDIEEREEQQEERREKDIFHYRDSDLIIVEPGSHESSCKYGAGTMWCTIMRNVPDHFYEYTQDNERLIYVIADVKYALHITPHGFDIWNEHNDMIGEDEFVAGLDYSGVDIDDIIPQVQDRSLRQVLEMISKLG